MTWSVCKVNRDKERGKSVKEITLNTKLYARGENYLENEETQRKLGEAQRETGAQTGER